jgi:hypothetical protein
MSKYNAVKVVIDGITFDSGKEGKRYQELRLLLRAGIISNLELQPRYNLIVDGVNCGYYKADFRYIDKEKQATIVEDVKGMKTPVYNLKKKLVEAIYKGTKIIEV